ncbi:WD40-repeat-containing domain protein [Biscogniauxia mediterranea]|nr:WD40-repeat-containing domain protein [Biscogniauxia mediterranea]
MSQKQSPAQPKSVLRGHRAQVHVTEFVRQNRRLASGDADGFVALWDLTIMRPRAVWRAHTSAILGIAGWGDDRIITEGRDNRLIVWKLAEADEAALSTALPLDGDAAAVERPQPWVLHILEINTMNFCSFAPCAARPEHENGGNDDTVSEELLVAVPNTLATEAVDIYHLPTQRRQHTVHLGSKTEKKGMVMALSLFWARGRLVLAAGYENGLAIAARRRRRSGSWDVVYRAQAHSQPILSLGVAPGARDYFLTSGADAVVAKHPVPPAQDDDDNGSGAKPAAVAGEEPAAVAGEEPAAESSASTTGRPNPSLLSAALSSTSTSTSASTSRPAKRTAAPVEAAAQPLQILNTKHAGQQGLKIRSDGRVFATAGWDAKVRVYSCRTLAELAVLKWHGVGCYAVAFAAVSTPAGADMDAGKGRNEEDREGEEAKEKGASTTTAVVPSGLSGQLSVKERRIRMAKEAHWLAAGSKDGKISLWDVY